MDKIHFRRFFKVFLSPTKRRTICFAYFIDCPTAKIPEIFCQEIFSWYKSNPYAAKEIVDCIT